ncbi:chromate efflux transporter [Leucobacter sp. PH1c]|uniref:chromate efflux transporter n=1 Tax=Leucobacter sp. PH1c TaxID=1397278 RepID=UPI0004692E36|nr:chromate efflux transporter [Leucobacter sp. PH1c]
MPETAAATDPAARPPARAREVASAFLRLGVTSFGGPTAHLGYFREEFVRRRRWVSDAQYAELVALCQFIPGPASSQLGFALGMLRAGAPGALLAWICFTLPSALLLGVLAAAGAGLAASAPAAWGGALLGLQAVAVAVVAHAVWGMARGLAPDLPRRAIALGGLALALVIPGTGGQLLAIIGGAGVGLLVAARHRGRGARAADSVAPTAGAPAPLPASDGELPIRIRPSVGIGAAVLLAALLLLLPLAARAWPELWLLVSETFFRAGALVFGGGHVVLPLLSAEPLIADGLRPDQLMSSYAAAQAVPGPLFTLAAPLGLDLGFAAGFGAWGALGLAALALVMIFLPGMLWLIAVLAVWARVRSHGSARGILWGVNAAVVGILAAALVSPVVPAGLTGWVPLGIALLGGALLARGRVPAWQIVILGALAGAAAAALGVPLGW